MINSYVICLIVSQSKNKKKIGKISEALTICTYLFELLPVSRLGHVIAMHSAAAILGGRTVSSTCRS